MHLSTPRRLSAALLVLVAASTCGCSGTTPSAPATDDAPAVGTGDAVLQMGDTWVRASVVQGSALSDSIARQYGVDRDPHALLLLVVAGKGPPASATLVPVDVTTRVASLAGDRQSIPMRQVRDGAEVDSIGTLRTTLPDTLRFDLQLQVAGQPPATLVFSREFYPQ